MAATPELLSCHYIENPTLGGPNAYSVQSRENRLPIGLFINYLFVGMWYNLLMLLSKIY